MPEYLAPGVYVEEVEMGPRPIEGVSTSTAGFVGCARRGPLNDPTLVTSFAEFQRTFGGFIPPGDVMQNKIRWLAYAVQGFFDNGGKRAYITRVAEVDPEKANKAEAASGFVPQIVGENAAFSLEKKASPGEMALRLNKPANSLTKNDRLLLKDGLQSEFLQYEDTVKEITLNNPLSNNYTAGTGVYFGATPGTDLAKLSKAAAAGTDTISLDPVEGIKEGDILLIKNTSPSNTGTALMKKGGTKAQLVSQVGSQSEINSEVVKVKDSPGDNSITIDGVLLNDYEPGASVYKLTDFKNASLLLDAEKNQEKIYLKKDTGIQNDNLMYFGEKGEVYKVQNVRDSDTVIEVTPKLQYAHEQGISVLKLVKAFEVKASSEGTWGNDIKVSVTPSGSSTKTTSKSDKNTNILYLENVNGMGPGTILKVNNTSPFNVTVKEASRTAGGGCVVIDGTLSQEVSESTTVEIQTFDLAVTYYNDQETFNDLSLNQDNSRFIETIVNPASNLVQIGEIGKTPDVMPMPVPNGLPGWPLAGGDNGIPGNNDDLNKIIIGEDAPEPGKRTGIYTLQNVDGISIAAVPGIDDRKVQEALVTLCGQTMKSCFAVLDPKKDADLAQIQAQRNPFDTSYAALYYPWVYAADPAGGGYINVPPSGHICGIYARTDVERGVFKAPANARINGAFGLEKLNGKFRVITDGTQEILNPKGIDCIRDFPGQGIVVWGARTMSANTLWKYINVRRLFIFIEQSLLKGLRWVVFEPNDQNLWARVVQTVSQFLTTIWRQGALMGSTAQEAFFVVCNETTMTQDDIDNGRLICQVGIAPVKPAEFVIIRIAQWQGGAAVSE